MILVTVGGRTEGFERLVTAMDQLAGDIDEAVVMQVGHSSHVPENAEFFKFVSGNRIDELTQTARVQVSHAGAGSILTAFRFGTPLVVVPRLKRYQENIDDHQLELAQALQQQGKLVAVFDDVSPKALGAAIEQAVSLTSSAESNGRAHPQLVQTLRQYVFDLTGQKAPIQDESAIKS